MKYQKKLMIVDAVQFFSRSLNTPEGVECGGPHGYWVMTPSGQVPVVDGDWIITSQTKDGPVDRYPCKPDIFVNIFEKVEGDSQ